jgi:hypothetical protein
MMKGAELLGICNQNTSSHASGDTSVSVRKRAELNFTPSTPSQITISSSAGIIQHESALDTTELSTSPAKKSGIPMPINGQVILRKETNQATTNNHNPSPSSTHIIGKMQQPQTPDASVAAATLKANDVNADEDPL